MNRAQLEIIVFLFVGISAYFYGHHKGYDESQTEVALQTAKANAEARQTEQKLNNQIADLTTQLVKVQNDAQKQIAKRDADIANGKLQLYVKTKTPVCATANAPSASGSDISTAQLDPTFAQSIVAVTDDGDIAIRKLNACIAIYNQVREQLNERTTTR